MMLLALEFSIRNFDPAMMSVSASKVLSLKFRVVLKFLIGKLTKNLKFLSKHRLLTIITLEFYLKLLQKYQLE